MLMKDKLYKKLELPMEVITKMKAYETMRRGELPDEIKENILKRSSWERGVQQLQQWMGEDPNGVGILWEMLSIACNDTWPQYQKKKIPESVFVYTMKFCTRFLNEYKQTYGEYRFVWGWWFPRQLSLDEFRIGSLEYEFVDGEKRK